MNTGTCYLVRYRYLVPGTWYTVYCNTRYEYKYLLNLPAKPNVIPYEQGTSLSLPAPCSYCSYDVAQYDEPR